MAKSPIECFGELTGLKPKVDKRGNKIELIIKVPFAEKMMADLAKAFNKDVGVTLIIDPKQQELEV